MELEDKTVISLECQNPIPGPAFLDGAVSTGTVSLAPRTNGVFAGTHWLVTEHEEGIVSLSSAGTTRGPRYLAGRPATTSVGLAPDAEPPHLGARWRVHDVGSDLISLQCLDHDLFLGGITDPAIRSVTLVDTATGPGSSGTRWVVTVVARPVLTVETDRTGERVVLRVSGTGFSPNDLLRFAAEGIWGDEPRLPRALPGSVRTDEHGSFTGLDIDIAPASTQPNNPAVVIRALDRHGLTAIATTDGYSAWSRDPQPL
ncbi:MAG: hypothetical protein Q4F67_05585 [Propionibacteriaceae bacterium]|nr:hypothetical protein [Propionibacteriaceae bacterium]